MSKALTKEAPVEGRELVARIALNGDLSGLTVAQQWDYYQTFCDYLGLDPITKPFDLLQLEDWKTKEKRTVLYANAGCAAQLARNHKITYSKPEYEFNEWLECLIVRVEAKLPNGRALWAEGVVAEIKQKKGVGLENAIKKASTQARRRATLALCGLSLPDESEIPDIQGAQPQAIAPPQTAKQLKPAIDEQPALTPLESQRKLARELCNELLALKVGRAKIEGKMAELCDGQTDLATLSEADLRGIIEEFSLWVDRIQSERESKTQEAA